MHILAWKDWHWKAPIAIYCVKCGDILLNEQIADLEKILGERDFVRNLVRSESF